MINAYCKDEGTTHSPALFSSFVTSVLFNLKKRGYLYGYVVLLLSTFTHKRNLTRCVGAKYFIRKHQKTSCFLNDKE